MSATDRAPSGVDAPLSFVFAEEHELFRESVRGFVRSRFADGYHARARSSAFPEREYRALVDQGLLGLTLPERLGGQGGDQMAYAIAMEELAYADFNLADLILLPSIVALLLTEHPVAADAAAGIAAGTRHVGLGLTEPGAGSDAGHLSTRAVPDAGGWRLHGEKTSITSAHMLDTAVVFAATPAGGSTAFLVELDDTVSRQRFADPGLHPVGRGSLTFDGTFVPAENRLSEEGRGFHLIMRVFDLSRAVIGLMACGAAQRALDLTAGWVTERTAFGRTLSQFQGVSFELAEHDTKIEMTRTLAYRAIGLRMAGQPHTRQAAMVKWFGPTAAVEAIRGCAILHGHYGWSEEMIFQQLMRDVSALEIADGTPPDPEARHRARHAGPRCRRMTDAGQWLMSGSPTLTTSHWPGSELTGVREVTLGDVLREATAEAPDRVALVDGAAPASTRRRWTHAELLRESEQVAQALAQRFAPGERVAVYAPNSPEWVILQHGAAFAGLVLVPLNPAYKYLEAEVMLRMTRSAGVFHAERYRDNDIAAVVARLHAELEHLHTTVVLDELAAFARTAQARTTPLPEVVAGDISHVQFTSGTTGVPKGALMHYRGIVNNGRFVAERAAFPDAGVWVNAMPMFHSGGMATSRCGCLGKHGTFVIAPGFEPEQMLELIETERANITLVVPTMILAMLDHPSFPDRDLSSLGTVLSGATDVPASLVHRAKAELGCRFSILFGQSEVCGVATATRLTDGVADQAETVGQPLPHAEVKIADPEDGSVLALGESGEICVRGYQTMRGYLDMPEATEATLDADGWLHMGDLGAMDERGFVRITGRLKDVIVRGGMNIYSREIENVIFEHPAVAQVSVIGLPDERYGEIVAAVLMVSDTACAPTPEDLVAYCRERLSRYKAPARWFLVDAFPLTASGKVQKFMLKDWIAEGIIQPTQGTRP